MTKKILFAGSYDVDVSSALKTISDVDITITKETLKSNDGSELTIEMEQGVLKLGSVDEINLYSMPERETIQRAHEALCENCIGVVFLLDNTDPEPIQVMLDNANLYQTFVTKEAIAVGLTNHDSSPKPDINDFHVSLREATMHIPVFSVDVHNKQDIITLIKALLYNLDSGIN